MRRITDEERRQVVQDLTIVGYTIKDTYGEVHFYMDEEDLISDLNDGTVEIDDDSINTVDVVARVGTKDLQKKDYELNEIEWEV